MGTPLTGKTPANTYDALIKIGDNSPLTSNLKVLSDGLGNDLPLTVSSTAITITGNATFSANVDATSAVLTVATQSANDNSTKAASTAYVDNSSGNADLDFGGDNASTGNVLLNTQTFQVSGTANEIVTAASNQSLTFSLDSSGVNLPDNSTAVTQTAGDSSTKIATTAFVSSESLAQDLDFSGDTGTGAVILNTETFAVTGTTNQIETTASGTGLALSLPSTVHRNLQGNVTGDLTGDVTGDLTGNVTATSVLADGVIGTTQAVADDSTKVATTAFVQDVVGTIPAGLVFQGTWNANTNTPTLASGTGTTGHFYIVSVAGSTDLDGVTDWAVGDWAVFVEQGATDQWEKVDNSSVLDGNGTGGKISKWAGSGNSVTLTDSVITEDSSNIGIGVIPSEKLDVGINSISGLKVGANGDGGATITAYQGSTNSNVRQLEFNVQNLQIKTGAPSGTSTSDAMNIDSAGALQLNTYGAGTLVSDASGNITSISGGGEGGPYLPLAGGIMVGNTRFNDNVNLRFGSADDLSIYHDGSNSYINDTGIGSLITQTSAYFLRQGGTNNTNNAIVANTSVDLYYDNSKKLETTSTGVTVTDDVTITSSSSPILRLTNTTSSQSWIQYVGSNDDFIIRDETDARSPLIINGSGNSTFSGDVTINNSSGDFGAEAILRGTTSTGTPKSEIAFKRFTTADGGTMVLRTSNSSGTIQDVLTLDTSKNATFAGNVTLNGDGKAYKLNTTSYDDWQVSVDSNGFIIYNETDARYDFKISGNGNATFGGSLDVGNFTFSGSGIVADAGMTIQTGGGSVNAITLASDGDTTFAGGITVNGDSSINRGNQTSGELLLGGTTDGGFVDFDSISLQLNTQRDPNTGTFINTSKSNARINLVGADGGSYVAISTASANNTSATERMRIDSAGRVGIGMTPSDFGGYMLQIDGDSQAYISIGNTTTGEGALNGLVIGNDATGADINQRESQPLRFYTSNTERMRITSAGEFGFGTSSDNVINGSIYIKAINAANTVVKVGHKTGSVSGSDFIAFYYNNVQIGGVAQNGTTAVSFNTSSDYRLKENVVDMTGALDRVAQLKPSRFNFIADSDTTIDGFLAHEVQSVVPEAITGTKDAVDEEGNPEYQGIDQSKLVPLLVGAIQELKAEIELLKAK